MANEIPLNGIILSGQPIGEYDRRIVLLTKERGKISCFAKGARKMNSPLLGNTRSFAFGTFYIFEGRTSYSLHSVHISNYFEKLLKDYEATLYACYFAEIADYFGQEGIEAKDEINLLYMAFCALTNERLKKEVIKSTYEIRSVILSGMCPPPDDTLGQYAKNETIKALFYYIISSPLDKLFKFTICDKTEKILKSISEQIIKKTVDKKLKSRDMLP